MATHPLPSKPFLSTPPGLVVLGGALMILAGVGQFSTVRYLLGPESAFSAPMLYAVVLAVWVVAIAGAVMLVLGAVRWAIFGRDSAAPPELQAQVAQAAELLRSVNDRLLISDTAKRIAYREQDRETLRKAIKEDIEKGDYEAALALVTEMSQAYGYRREAEAYRDEILDARDRTMDQQVTEAVTRLDEVIATHNWEKAAREAAKVQRLFPDSPRVRALDKHVREAREAHKHDLERQFLAAAQKDDVEGAIALLKELDKYLTEHEAEPFRETARGVIGKKRQNLGVQFKMAVHDREWTMAVTVGEQIIRDFPNTKMADEVRSMLDLLRERAAGEQAARPREMA